MVSPVSESNLPPERWRPYFDRAGIEFGYRPLAARAGLTPTRTHRLVRGGGTTDQAIQKVADALGVKASKVRELRGEPAVEIDPFILPDDAGRLNDTERDVVRRVVRALLDARDRHDADQPASDADRPPASGTPREDEQGEKTARVVHIKRDDLNEQQSSPEAEPEPLPEERPEDAWAARKRDPRFQPDIPISEDIGEESQDDGKDW